MTLDMPRSLAMAAFARDAPVKIGNGAGTGWNFSCRDFYRRHRTGRLCPIRRFPQHAPLGSTIKVKPEFEAVQSSTLVKKRTMRSFTLAAILLGTATAFPALAFSSCATQPIAPATQLPVVGGDPLIDGRSLVVAYGGWNRTVSILTSDDFGATLSARAGRVQPGGTTTGSTRMAWGDGGTVYLAWELDTGAFPNLVSSVYFSYSRDDGASWSPVAFLGMGQFPVVAASGASVHVLYLAGGVPGVVPKPAVR